MIEAPLQHNLNQSQDILLEQLIQQQIKHIRNENLNTMSTQQCNDYQNHNLTANVYFDKQLTHLVVSEQFNFTNISLLLTQAFKMNKIDTSEEACRLRWTYLHKNRENMLKIKEEEKQQKRAKSVAAFSNPYSLYSVDQLIQKLQQTEKQKQAKNQFGPKVMQPTPSGYNIFKDSFRKINNLQQYNELQQKMKLALKQAQQQVYSQLPLYYTPQYQNLQQFKVKGEQLTAQKAKQLLAFQIQMDKIGRELTQRKQEEQQQKYQRLIRQRIQKQQVVKKVSHSADLEDNWDEYQSD